MVTFQLTGFAGPDLANMVQDAVMRSDYSDQELYDVRIPMKYSMLNYVLNFDDLAQTITQWRKLAILDPSYAIPTNATTLKLKLKQMLSKLFMWYAAPMASSQTLFNSETVTVISELASCLHDQSQIIKKLTKELDDLRGKNV